MESSLSRISTTGGSANGLSYERKTTNRVEYNRRAFSDGILLQQQQQFYHTAVKRRKVKHWRSRMHLRPRKIVILGDMGTGKSSLVSSYCNDKFTETYTPTLLRSMSTDAIVSMRTVKQKLDLIIIDTPGRKDYRPIRACTYKKVDLILLVFALDEPETLDQACNYWIGEINEFLNPDIPIILVGTKQDIRDEICTTICHCELCTQSFRYSCWNVNSAGSVDEHLLEDTAIVTYEQGREAADKIGADAYIETSAKYRIGIRDVFEKGSNVALKRYRRKRKIKGQGIEGSCVIL